MRARLLLIQLVVCLRMMALFGTLIDIVIIVKMNYDEENIFFLLYSLGRLCCLFKLKLLINILVCIFFAPPCVVCLKVLAWKQLMEKGSSLCSFLFLFLLTFLIKAVICFELLLKLLLLQHLTGRLRWWSRLFSGIIGAMVILWASVWLRYSLIIYFIYMRSNMYLGPTAAHDII